MQGVDSAQSVLIADNATAIAANDGDITNLVAVDSAQSVLIADNASAISANDGDITALQGVDSAQSALIVKLQSDVTANDGDITTLQGVDSAQSVLIADNATAIAAITDIQGTDLDQFSEVIAYVNSVSSTGDLDLTNFMATSNANDSTHSTAIAALQAVDSTQSTAIAANASAIGSNDADIKDLQDAMTANDADNVVLHTESSVQSTAIAANLASIGALENSVDSLESIDSLLSAEIAALDTKLDEGDKMLHQEGTFVDIVRFTLPFEVRFGTNDDIHVHVNGHTIKPFVGELSDEARNTDHGWFTADGRNFEFINIGYDLEVDDVLYVQAVEA